MTDLSDESAFADGEVDSGEEFGDSDVAEEESGDESGDSEEEAGEPPVFVTRRRRPIQLDVSDRSELPDTERDSDVEGGALPVKADLSAFRGLLEVDSIAKHVSAKVPLRRLMVLVCVNKAVRANFQDILRERLRRENAPTQMARWCSRENRLSRGPVLSLDLSDWARDLYQEYPRFNFAVNCDLLVRNIAAGPMDDFNLSVRFAELGRYGRRRDNFIHVIVNDAYFLYGSMRFLPARDFDGPLLDNIQAYAGDGEDPQPRVIGRYPTLVYLTLNGVEWLGETLSGLGGNSNGAHSEFRFHNTPNGVEQALNFAQGIVRAAMAAVAPRPAVGDGGPA
jgi:hypothetical protein